MSLWLAISGIIVLTLVIVAAAWLWRKHSADGRIAAVSLIGSSLVAIAVFAAQADIDGRQAARFKTLDDRRQAQADRQQLQLSLGFEDDLTGIDLHGRDLRGFYLPDKDFSDANLEHAQLARAFLKQSKFFETHMRGADLSGARAAGDYEPPDDALGHGSFSNTTTFGGADLVDANLTGADLTGADLSDADLRDVVIHDTTLVGADFEGADLRGVRFGSADLHGANFTKADLRHADLSHVDGLEDSYDPGWISSKDGPASVSLSYYSEATRLPEGFRPKAALMVAVSDDVPLPQD